MASINCVNALRRNWILLVFGGLLVLVVVVIVASESLAGTASGSYQAGYNYGFSHAPSPREALAPSAKEESTVVTVAVERCTTELQFLGGTVATRQQWKSGCEAGWIKKNAHATVGTEAMTTTST